MTFLRYLALGIASLGLSYGVYTNRTQNENLSAQPRVLDNNLPLSAIQNSSEGFCSQFLDLKQKVAAAEPQRTWYGITLGYVVIDTPENIQRYEKLERTLNRVNDEYIRRCQSF